jgi:hypothetical protein
VSLEQLQAMDLALDLPIAPLQRETRPDCGLVGQQSFGIPPQLGDTPGFRSGNPWRQLLTQALSDQAKDGLSQRIRLGNGRRCLA